MFPRIASPFYYIILQLLCCDADWHTMSANKRQRWSETVIPNFFFNHAWTAYILHITTLKRTSLRTNLPDSYQPQGTHWLVCHTWRDTSPRYTKVKAGSSVHQNLEYMASSPASLLSSIKFPRDSSDYVVVGEGHQPFKLGKEMCRCCCLSLVTVHCFLSRAETLWLRCTASHDSLQVSQSSFRKLS